MCPSFGPSHSWKIVWNGKYVEKKSSPESQLLWRTSHLLCFVTSRNVWHPPWIIFSQHFRLGLFLRKCYNFPQFLGVLLYIEISPDKIQDNNQDDSKQATDWQKRNNQTLLLVTIHEIEKKEANRKKVDIDRRAEDEVEKVPSDLLFSKAVVHWVSWW